MTTITEYQLESDASFSSRRFPIITRLLPRYRLYTPLYKYTKSD